MGQPRAHSESAASGQPDVAVRPISRNTLMPRASARTQLLHAAGAWGLGALALGWRGAAWLSAESFTLVLLVHGVALGLLKAHYIIEPAARRAADRIEARGRMACAGGFFSWKVWLGVFLMMFIGHALKLTPLPREVLGVLYVAVATGLIVGGRVYILRAFPRKATDA